MTLSRGRPSKFKTEFVEQARKLCAFGATEVELADFFKVTTPTIWKWKCDNQDFLSAVKIGKAIADDRVEHAIYHRAIGYSFETEKIFMPPGSKKPVRVPYREHVPPDIGAAIFWLKNRRPHYWKDVQRLEHGVPGEFDTIDDVAELRRIILGAAEEAGLGLKEIEVIAEQREADKARRAD